MPFSHHSHSGQFCAHAKNSLSEVVLTALAKHMRVFALTEHMPRSDHDLYPEELESGYTSERLANDFEAYVEEANRLRQEHKDHRAPLGCGKFMQILIGFEAEWIEPKESTRRVQDLICRHDFDYFIGSVHHVRSIPIDFNNEMYGRAREACGGSDEALFSDYFDAQFEMLQALKPRIVGHFDLIRLLSDEPDADWRHLNNGQVWEKIERNLRFVVEYGGLLELNSAALRKGLREPYPRSEICTAFMGVGGQFVMSDDSHGVDQVGTNYDKLLQFMRDIGLKEVMYLITEDGWLMTRSVQLRDLETLSFWKA